MNTSQLYRQTRSSTVMANAAECRERRMRLATEFRAALVEQLGVAPETAVRAALIDAAVSCYVEIQELSTLFLRAKASIAQQRQLGLARGQLARLLACLGVASAATPSQEAESVDTAPSPADWLAGATASSDADPDGAV